MPEDIGGVFVKIGGDWTDLKNSLGAAADFAGSKASSLAAAWMSPLGVVTTAIVGIGAAAVDVASRYEEAMNKIHVGTGATGEELERLGESFRGVFLQVPQSAEEVATAIADLNTRLGLTGPALDKMAKALLDVADMMGEDIQGMVKATTQAYKDWGVESDKVAEKNDYLFKVTQQTGIGFTDLANSMAKHGSTFRNLGVSFEEAAALIGKMQMETPNAEKAITGLAKAVASMTKEGIPAKEAISAVFSSIKNAPSDLQAAQVALEVFGAKAGPEMAEKIRSGKFELDALMKTIAESPNTIAEADDATDTLSEKLTILMKNMQDLLAPVGEFLIEFGKAAADAFNSLFAPMDQAGGKMHALVAFAQPLLDVLAKIGPVVQTLVAFWVGLASAIGETSAFQKAVQFIGLLAGAIRDSLVKQIEFVIDLWNGFLNLMKLIPGVNEAIAKGQKIMTDALAAGKKGTTEAATAMGKFSGEVKLSTKPTEDASAAIQGLGKAAEKAREEAKKAEEEYRKFKAQMAASRPEAVLLSSVLQKLESNKVELIGKVASLRAGLLGEAADTRTLTASLEGLVAAVGSVNNKTRSLSNIELPAAIAVAKDMRAEIEKVEGAYKTLGVASARELKEVAEEHRKAYEKIKDHAGEKSIDAQKAWVKYQEAVIAAAKAAGEDIPKEQQKALDKMKEQLGISTGQQKDAWSEYTKQVSTIITNFAQDTAKILFDGDLSWGEKAKAMWGKIKEALVSSFIEPATKAIGDFIAGALKDLLGGSGLGGIWDAMKGIGSAIGGLFGGGGGSSVIGLGTGISSEVAQAIGMGGTAAAGAVGSVGSAAGSAASGAASAPGQAAGMGVSAVTGMVTGIASAVSGVIGNFQMAGMNKSLDLIEHEVRFSQIHLKELVERGQNVFLAELPVIRSLWVQFLDHHAWRIHDVWATLETMMGLSRDANTFLGNLELALTSAGPRSLSINVLNPQFKDRSDIDYMVDTISRNLR